MILVDTSAWIAFFQGEKQAAEIVDDLLLENQAAVCGPVLTEIYRGFRRERDRRKVIELFEGCRILSQPDNLWEDAGDLGFMLQKTQKKTGTVDLLIACYALAYQIPLFTLDSDFKRMKDAGIHLDLV